MNLKPIDVGGLDVPTRLPDLPRDIHVFVNYVGDREVKRMHRDNGLSKTDVKRLTQLMSNPETPAEVQDEESSPWVDFVDGTALELGFVQYDTKGEYAGYTSSAPSFPDNYIEVRPDRYERHCAMKAAQQETALLDLLLKRDQASANEFFHQGVLGRLDGFDSFGSATGIMPTLDFTAARRFLLSLLAKCPTGEWLSTASLVRYLKEHHRYFLIPQKPQFKSKWDAGEGRYGNFRESKKRWGERTAIKVSDEDSFERVEGRYVERFLEGIPLLLRYVDVAYTKTHPQAIYPSLGCLKAFRVSERLLRALAREIAEPRVTVTPDFDVHVQAETYPAGLLSELAPLCERISEGASIVLKLQKQKVAAARAANPRLDVLALLQRCSANELPANVVRELSDWSQHGEKFVLYQHLALLEAEKSLEAADPFTVERVAPGMLLVHSPDKLFAELERQELMPWRVKHGEKALSPLPKNARTRFPKQAAGEDKRRVAKTRVTLLRVTRVQLRCPDREFLQALQRILLEAKCPIDTDREGLTLAYSGPYESQVSHAVRALRKEYQVTIEDAG